jgi:hypothetical protein
MNSVFFGKPLSRIVFMLPEAFNQIGCHANAKRAIAAAGTHVDAGLLNHRKMMLDSRLRGNDEIRL